MKNGPLVNPLGMRALTWSVHTDGTSPSLNTPETDSNLGIKGMYTHSTTYTVKCPPMLQWKRMERDWKGLMLPWSCSICWKTIALIGGSYHLLQSSFQTWKSTQIIQIIQIPCPPRVELRAHTSWNTWNRVARCHCYAKHGNAQSARMLVRAQQGLVVRRDGHAATDTTGVWVLNTP